MSKERATKRTKKTEKIWDGPGEELTVLARAAAAAEVSTVTATHKELYEKLESRIAGLTEQVEKLQKVVDEKVIHARYTSF